MPCLRTYTPDPEASKYTIYVEGFMDSNTYLKNSNARLLIEIKIKCITIIIYIIFFKKYTTESERRSFLTCVEVEKFFFFFENSAILHIGPPLMRPKRL